MCSAILSSDTLVRWGEFETGCSTTNVLVEFGNKMVSSTPPTNRLSSIVAVTTDFHTKHHDASTVIPKTLWYTWLPDLPKIIPRKNLGIVDNIIRIKLTIKIGSFGKLSYFSFQIINIFLTPLATHPEIICTKPLSVQVPGRGVSIHNDTVRHEARWYTCIDNEANIPTFK